LKEYLQLISAWEEVHPEGVAKHLANVTFSNLFIAFEKNNFHRLTATQQLLFSGKKLKDAVVGVKKPALNQAKVLMWPVSLNHCENMVPVYYALKEKNVDTLVVTNKKGIYDYLKSIGVEAHFIEIYNWLPYLRRVSVYNKISSFTPKGIKESAVKLFKAVLKRYMDENLAILGASAWLLKAVKPEMVFVGFDITAEGRAMCLTAREAGIETRCIQHGDIAGFFDNFHIASAWYVFGDQAKETLSRHGYNNTVISGSPALDKIYSNFKQRRASEQKEILALFSGPGVGTSMEHHIMQFDAIFSWNVKNPTVKITVKFHPKDKIENYTELIEKYPSHTIQFSSEMSGGQGKNIFEWLEPAGLVLTGASTAAMEAILMDIPVVSLDFKQEYQSVEFVKSGAICQVNQPEELHKTLDSWFRNPGHFENYISEGKKYINRYYLLDGQAGRRVAEHVIGG